MALTEFEIEDHIARRIGMARNQLKRRLNHSLATAGYDLTADHIILLKITAEHDGVVQSDMVDCLGRDKTAVTRYIDSLESLGYVERAQDPGDRRRNLLHVTATGRKLLRSIYPIIGSIESQAVEGVSQRELVICKDVLRRVYENLVAVNDSADANSKSK